MSHGGDVGVHGSGRRGPGGELLDRGAYPPRGLRVGRPVEHQVGVAGVVGERPADGAQEFLQPVAVRAGQGLVGGGRDLRRGQPQRARRSGRPCWRTGGRRSRCPRRPGRRCPRCRRRRPTRRTARGRRRGCGGNSARRRGGGPGPGARGRAGRWCSSSVLGGDGLPLGLLRSRPRPRCGAGGRDRQAGQRGQDEHGGHDGEPGRVPGSPWAGRTAPAAR